MYLPRKQRVKLSIKWHGPCSIISKKHPVYEIECIINNTVTRKWITRDKLRRCEKLAEIKEIENISENNVDVTNNDDNVPESIFETIEDKETIINPRQRLNLRPVIRLPERFGEIYSHALKL